jgi:polysaccharide biosynthesis protein PslG
VGTARAQSRGSWAIRFAVLLVGLVLSLLAASPAASGQELFGIAQGSGRLDSRDLRAMKAAGVRTERFLLNWASVQPSGGGSFKWGGTDRFVGALASHNIRPVPFVWGSPRWAAKKANRPPLHSAKWKQAWQKFLAAAVRRYRPGGTYWSGGGPYQQAHPGAKPRPINALQIWNEPSLSKFFPARKSARKYAELVTISDRAITGASHKVKVVLAGLTGLAKPRAWTFLDKLYRSKGIKHHFDAAALHPYAPTIRQFRAETRRFRGVMRKHHDGHTALWLTEVGWGSEKPTRRWPLNKGLRGQKRMLSKSFALVRHNRRAWHIRRVFWFDWRDPASRAQVDCSFCDSSGLFKHSRKRKPAYRAFRHFAR